VIFLIGYRGCGKTTVARLLAEGLGWPWLDADDLLERQNGRTVREIFAAEGEEGFRAKEEAILSEICKLNHQVIATGGGAVLRRSNRDRLRASGWVVWLTADADTLHQRLQRDEGTADRRPALTTAPPLEEIANLLQRREPLYRGCAHLIVSTVGRKPEDVAAEIGAVWWARATATPASS
jgi:shikimate kinase